MLHICSLVSAVATTSQALYNPCISLGYHAPGGGAPAGSWSRRGWDAHKPPDPHAELVGAWAGASAGRPGSGYGNDARSAPGGYDAEESAGRMGGGGFGSDAQSRAEASGSAMGTQSGAARFWDVPQVGINREQPEAHNGGEYGNGRDAGGGGGGSSAAGAQPWPEARGAAAGLQNGDARFWGNAQDGTERRQPEAPESRERTGIYQHSGRSGTPPVSLGVFPRSAGAAGHGLEPSANPQLNPDARSWVGNGRAGWAKDGPSEERAPVSQAASAQQTAAQLQGWANPAAAPPPGYPTASPERRAPSLRPYPGQHPGAANGRMGAGGSGNGGAPAVSGAAGAAAGTAERRPGSGPNADPSPAQANAAVRAGAPVTEVGSGGAPAVATDAVGARSGVDWAAEALPLSAVPEAFEEAFPGTQHGAPARPAKQVGALCWSLLVGMMKCEAEALPAVLEAFEEAFPGTQRGAPAPPRPAKQVGALL